ncbi:MAG TPA: MotA/TolQ/ExbB proton channel family protein [Fibrobacteraceae bacterium]|nr:MotA/TolQ/ExbB proton channel family protein [Fibrobacteraceae bacterium]
MMDTSKIFDTIYYLVKSGGPVMFPIFLVGAWGFYLVFSAIDRLGRDFLRRDLQGVIHRYGELLHTDDIGAVRAFLHKNKGLVSHQLLRAMEHPDWSAHRLHVTMQERMGAKLLELDRGMHLATVMAATAPLLGLLGTVTGMVSTFDVIQHFGNSNPVLLADGISEALITTQSGLLIAFPMLLLLRRAEERGNWIRKQMELGMAITLNWAYAREEVDHG